MWHLVALLLLCLLCSTLLSFAFALRCFALLCFCFFLPFDTESLATQFCLFCFAQQSKATLHVKPWCYAFALLALLLYFFAGDCATLPCPFFEELLYFFARDCATKPGTKPFPHAWDMVARSLATFAEALFFRLFFKAYSNLSRALS